MSPTPQKQGGGAAGYILMSPANDARPRMGRPLRFALIAAGVLVLLLVLLPFLIPLSVYKDRVEAELSAALGRPVRIEGPMKLTVFPDLGIRAEQVVVTNVPGGQAPYLAQADDVRVAASFRALFAGRIEVSQIVVDHPDFRFEVDAAGRPNWNIAPAQARPSGLLDRMKTSVAEVKLAGGTARYEDARSNTREDVQNLDATLDWFGSTLALEGELTDGGERLAFVAKAADPTALVNTRPSHVDLSLTSDLVQASFKGALTLNGPASGALKFDTPSLRKLAAWRGRGLPSVGGLGPLSIQAKFDRSNTGYTLSDLKLALDETAITGVLTVDNSQSTPLLKGALALDNLDVDPYYPAARKEAVDARRCLGCHALRPVAAQPVRCRSHIGYRQAEHPRAHPAARQASRRAEGGRARYALRTARDLWRQRHNGSACRCVAADTRLPHAPQHPPLRGQASSGRHAGCYRN